VAVNRPPLPLVLLFGPTASGKTALACRLCAALASTHPLEIVSADSAQVFIGMDIGSAKPDAKTLSQYPHHLINRVTPDQSYSAALFCRDAHRVFDEIRARGATPLLVGGSMLYVKALLGGLADLPPSDPEYRRALTLQASRQGWPFLHQRLTQCDPITAARLSPQDGQRISRALEIFERTGITQSAWITQDTARQDQISSFDCLPLSLFPQDRSVLHERIAQRFRSMLAQGFVDEVIALRSRYRLVSDCPSMRCAGYRQIWAMLEGQLPETQLEERALAATRQLAKRQLTWMKGWFTQQLPVRRFDSLTTDVHKSLLAETRQFLDARRAAI
jgi:tRNA dimethylallyltransferase